MGQVRAQAERCTTETLQGRYVFTGRGFIEPGEPGIRRVHYGIFVFDGTGRFSGKQSSNAGFYTLDADCTGTMTFVPVVNPGSQIHWDLYLTEDHKRSHIIRMDDGSMAVRSFEK
jgi:hypothetical protein